MLKPASREDVIGITVENLVATIDLLEIAKEALIGKNIQETSRLLRIARSDLGIYESRLRMRTMQN